MTSDRRLGPAILLALGFLSAAASIVVAAARPQEQVQAQSQVQKDAEKKAPANPREAARKKAREKKAAEAAAKPAGAAPAPAQPASPSSGAFSGLAVSPTVFYIRKGPALESVVSLTLKNAGPAVEAAVTATLDGRPLAVPPVRLERGDNAVRVKVPESSRPVRAKFTIAAGPASATAEAMLEPQRKWTVYLFHHSHTDIGYTDLQSRVGKNHLAYLDSVIDYCRQTDDYPDDARFRWNIEVSYVLQAYAASRPPDKIRQLYDLLKSGRVELSGLQLNVSDGFSSEGLVRAVAGAPEMARRGGFDVRSAMNNDVTGFSWGLPQIFRQAGIRWFATGINETRSLAPLRRPNAFWWEGPDGSRVLVWNGEHYLFANTELAMHQPFAESAPKLDAYLRALAARGDFPHDIIAFNIGAWVTDNCPPGRALSDRVKEWNETFAYPRLRLATMREFFERLEASAGKSLPVYKLGWPDYWTDGVASTAYETGLNRRAHEGLIAAETVQAATAALGAGDPARDELREAFDLAAFYDEHTWGSANSISDPQSEDARGQWALKSGFAYRANEAARTLLRRGVDRWAGMIPSPDESTFAVFNTLGWPRTDAVAAPVPERLRKAAFRVVDRRSGAEVPFQRETPESILLLARDVPSLGYAVYGFEPAGGGSARTPAAPVDPAAPKPEAGETAAPAAAAVNVLENAFYRLTVDPKTGGVSSLVDKETNRELVDAACAWPLNAYIHELANGGRAAVDNMKQRTTFDRRTPQKVEVSAGPSGPVASSLVVRSLPRGGTRLEQRIVLYNDLKRIDFIDDLDKSKTFEPEAVYFAFPFRVGPVAPAAGAVAAPTPAPKKRKRAKAGAAPAVSARPAVRFEVADADMAPESEQLPRTTRDWHSVQRWVEFAGADARVVWSPVEALLVQFGDINTGKWLTTLDVGNARVFSYAMNNYWMTNFKAAQDGRTRFRYAMTSGPGGPSDRAGATRFGAETHTPLLSQRILPKNAGTLLPGSEDSLAAVDRPNVILQALKTAEDGSGALVVRLREVAGTGGPVRLSGRLFRGEAVRAVTSDILEADGAPLAVADGVIALTVKPFEIVTVKVKRG